MLELARLCARGSARLARNFVYKFISRHLRLAGFLGCAVLSSHSAQIWSLLLCPLPPPCGPRLLRVLPKCTCAFLHASHVLKAPIFQRHYNLQTFCTRPCVALERACADPCMACFYTLHNRTVVYAQLPFGDCSCRRAEPKLRRLTRNVSIGGCNRTVLQIRLNLLML